MRQVELIDISKSYDKQTNVLNNINLSINKGEFFVLVGPSGCGKSTLLRMIAGLEEIIGGVLKLNDEVANHLPPKDRNLSMVFQNYALYPHLTVEQNILFGLKVKKVDKKEQKRKLIETKDDFKAAGLDPEKAPETFEEIEEASKKIVESNDQMKGFALQAYGWLFEELLANQGGLLMNNDNGRSETPTEVAFDNEKGKSIFEWAKRMVDDGTFANYGTNADNMVSGFLAGDVAMFLQSSAFQEMLLITHHLK